MSYRIPFIQYLQPKGRRKRQFYFLKDEDVFNKAREVIEKGGRFEAEVLTIGNCVSFECVNRRDTDETWALEVCVNGPAVVEAIERLVNTAHARVTGGNDG